MTTLRDFFFTVRCSCKLSRRYRNCLSVTGVTFFIPALLFLRQKSYLMGSLSAVLTATTVVYHSTHDSRLRAIDVSMVWLNGFTGLVQCLVGMARHGPNVYLVLVLLGVAALNTINLGARFEDRNGCIALQWHLAVHALTTLSLTCLALGWGDEGWI